MLLAGVASAPLEVGGSTTGGVAWASSAGAGGGASTVSLIGLVGGGVGGASGSGLSPGGMGNSALVVMAIAGVALSPLGCLFFFMQKKK